MPSQNMLPKGKRRHSVRAEYRATRGLEPAEAPVVPQVSLDPYAPEAETSTRTLTIPEEARGLRLDQYLAQALPEISRSRVQLLIAAGQVRVGDAAVQGKHRVVPGECVTLEGSPRPAPLAATAEAIPLEIMYEDASLAVVNKPAGMTVHAGAAKPRAGGARAQAEAEDDESEAEAEGDPRSSGTLVNALLHHFAGQLSGVGGALRPGIVHRLDRQTSGLLLVAKDDRTHRRLAEAFAARTVEKSYVALVHGDLRGRGASRDEVTVALPIGRDLQRRTRMTTRRPVEAPGVRAAVSHVRAVERLETAYGAFTLVEVRIETGRTHQIRVHLQALGNPVVGDTLYGAPGALRAAAPATPGRSSGKVRSAAAPDLPALELGRNFLHAARLGFVHPGTQARMEMEAPLPDELRRLLEQLRAAPVGGSAAAPATKTVGGRGGRKLNPIESTG